MAQIDTTKTWLPGDSVDATGMNNIIDQATAEDALITAQTTLGTVDPAADYVLIIDSSAVAPKLRKTLVEKLQATGGVDTVDFAPSNPAPTAIFTGNVSPTSGTSLITLSMKNQTGNKVLAAPADGTSGTPGFRVLSAADMPFATVTIAASAIDWSLGVMFTKTLAANTTFSFTGASAGQTIRVLLVQDASHTVAWTGGGLVVRWPGGTNHVMTTGAGSRDLLTFHFIGGLYYGTFEPDFGL